MAYTREQETVLDNLAQAIAVDRLCSSLELDKTMAAMAMTLYGLTADAGDELNEKTARHMSGLRDKPEDAVCAAGQILFGEDGIGVENLLVSAHDAHTSGDDLLSEGGRFAKFMGISLAIEDKCKDFSLQADATMGDHLDAEDHEAARNWIPVEKEEALHLIDEIGCDAAIKLSMSYTDLAMDNVWSKD